MDKGGREGVYKKEEGGKEECGTGRECGKVWEGDR